MTINFAYEFFEHIPAIHQKLKTLKEVGLGYVTLGQPSTTLSGGESQRVKLSSELAKRDTGNTLYILDEPTTGLHFEDVRILLKALIGGCIKQCACQRPDLEFYFIFWKIPIHTNIPELSSSVLAPSTNSMPPSGS